jgi:hypothetical protein
MNSQDVAQTLLNVKCGGGSVDNLPNWDSVCQGFLNLIF